MFIGKKLKRENEKKGYSRSLKKTQKKNRKPERKLSVRNRALWAQNFNRCKDTLFLIKT